jgi:DNA-binding CsgD family transcriptional regulator
MAVPDRGAGIPYSPAAHGHPVPGGASSLIAQVRDARLHPPAGDLVVTGWMSTLVKGSGLPVSRVAALGQVAQTAMRLGHASDCLAVLAEQRDAAGDDPVALVWALTASSVCRSAFGQLGLARADLAQVRKACNRAAPLLAEPFWRFAEILCSWLEGKWAAAHARAAALDESGASPFAPALAGTVAALRMELLRGLGPPHGCRQLAGRLEGGEPAEMGAWALAGLDADEGRSADALQRLAAVCDIGTRSVHRAALPLVLHRMAEIAFLRGDERLTCYAAAALAGLDQAAPLHQILTGLAHAYATRNPASALRAQELAEAEGAATLAAEALTARGRVGDDPVATLAAAYAAWCHIGAPGKARGVAAAMRAAGLPAPLANHRLTRAPIDQDTLTERERELARLVHEGRTNQQIARTLNISVKTVEAYLTRVYRKTSCTSRVELAVAVTERRIQVGQ